MGYHIWSLANLPVNDALNLYVFVLGDRHWTEGPSASIEQNFSKLAREVGPNAAIVIGHEGAHLRHQLANSLEGRMQYWSDTREKWPELREFVYDSEENGPAILILGAHPDNLTKDDLVIYAPLRKVQESFGSMDKFFDSLCDFALNRKQENQDFLSHFEEKVRGSFTDKTDLLELKPNVAGIGLNLNEVIRRLEVWWYGDRMKRET